MQAGDRPAIESLTILKLFSAFYEKAIEVYIAAMSYGNILLFTNCGCAP